MFNYGDITWETGDASGGSGGMGGTPAAAGYSAGNGSSGSFLQVPGSLETGKFVAGGANDLATYTNVTGGVGGRQIYKVRNGSAGNSATGVEGVITAGGSPVVGAIVQVCPAGGTAQCVFQTRTSSSGSYEAVGIEPGDYVVKAYPPGGTTVKPRSATVTVVDQERATVDLELSTVKGPPPGTSISPTIGSGSPPMVSMWSSVKLQTTGCIGGTVTYQVIGTEPLDSGVWASGAMTGDADGTYTATVGLLLPHKGDASVAISIVCPSAGNQSFAFDVYIDPSGRILDQEGDPVEGAVVTLESSDSTEGPWTAVPDGSAVMSPANRTNPTTTGADGAYGWDVVGGYYRLSVSAEGCTAPGGGDVLRSDALTIPPPVIGLDLVLDCPRLGDVTPPTINATPLTLEGNTTGGWSGTLTGVTATDDVSGPGEVTLTNNAPALLGLGVTSVTWTATDAAGNTASVDQAVTVLDTSKPAITCPPDVRRTYVTSPVVGTATATDVVDAAPRVTSNAPPSWGLGSVDVTWTATDASGNVRTCVQKVTLVVAAESTTAAGDQHSLALKADGSVVAWGSGGNGQLGRGGTTASTVPVVVSGLTGVRTLAAGGLSSLALKGDGSVWAWGDNSQGQLGLTTGTTILFPTRVSGLPPMKALAAGRFHAVAVALDGTVWSWGANSFGQLGRTGSAAPAKVSGLAGIDHVAAGAYHSAALRSDGRVLTWGAGYAGQLGDGTAVNQRTAPALVPGLTDVASIGAGSLNMMAVTTSGAIRIWGDNASGQIGDSTTTRRASPVAPTGGCLARSATGGDATTYVLCVDGRVLAVGKNASGQLGDGSTTTRRTLVAVTGLGDAVGVSAGASHAVAVTAAGVPQVWGENKHGQLGDGTTTVRKAPVGVSGLTGLMPTGA